MDQKTIRKLERERERAIAEVVILFSINQKHPLLLDLTPSFLIIGIGWDGATTPEEGIKNVKGCEVRILKTGEAVREYNRRKERGEDVAIHVHSTC